MNDKSMLSMAEAAKMVGLTRPTFYRKVEELGITISEEAGKKKVSASELIRVFGHDFKIKNDEEGSSKLSKKVSADNNTQPLNLKDLEIKVAILESQLKTEKDIQNEIRSEIAYFKEQIALEKEEKKRITLLLEDQRESRGDEWKSSIRALEQRLANQEKAAKEREEKEQKLLDENKRIKQAYMKQKQALEAEQNKSIWKKLFG